MTTTTKTPAAKTTPAKAPAKKAPAKPAAKPVAPKAAPAKVAAPSTKLRWKANGEPDAKNRVPVVGTSGNLEYSITGSERSWKTTVTVDGGKPETIAEDVSRQGAYSKAVAHFKGLNITANVA